MMISEPEKRLRDILDKYFTLDDKVHLDELLECFYSLVTGYDEAVEVLEELGFTTTLAYDEDQGGMVLTVSVPDLTQ